MAVRDDSGESERVDGDAAAIDAQFPLIYRELRRLAQRYLSGSGDGTMQATALVNEAYLKLVAQTRSGWLDRAHFFAVAARAVRQVLLDHAKGKGRARRWAGQQRVSLDEALTLGQIPDTHAFALMQALDRLSTEHPEQARVVEMRFFGGLTHEEIAAVLDVSVRTVERRWRFGRAWLYCALSDDGPADG